MTAPAAGGPYDLLIIGGGPAGYVGAIRAAQLGLKTALVEREKLGGTCVHVGCIPTKVLLHTAELLGDIRGAGEMGVQVGDVRLDYGQVRRRMDRVVTANFRGIEFLMRKNGIALFPGAGRFVTPTQVRVAATDGSEVSLEARHTLVATGSRPRSLPGVVIDNDRVLDNAGALRLPEVPRSIAILGAGAVGAEFASAFAAFGSTVTLIEMMPAILPLEDEELSGVVAKELGRRGVAIRTGTSVTGVTAAGDSVRIALRTGTGDETLEADYALDPTLAPRATFTIPQIASVGLTERQAREQGRDVTVGRFPFIANGRARILGRAEGLVKIVADRALGEILGVHLVGPEVTELLPEAVLGKSLEATVLEIGNAVHAHPTLSEAVKEAALGALGRGVHT